MQSGDRLPRCVLGDCARLATAIVCAGLCGCAHAEQEAQAKQLSALQVQLQRYNEAQQRIELDTAERLAKLEGLLTARLTELKTELATLQAELHAQREGAVASQEGMSDPAQVSDPTAQNQRRTASRRPRRKRKEKAEEPAPTTASEPEAVRALMASVAARLQDASDPKGGTPLSAAHREQAQQQLVEADRAAAQGLWQRANELAREAQGWLDGRTSRPDVASDVRALVRDAEGLFPGAVRLLGDEVRIQLPLRRAAEGELPVDRAALDHIARLAKVYGSLSVTLQVRETDPDEARAARQLEAVRRHLVDQGHVRSERLRDASPSSKRQATGRTLVLAFASS